MKIVASFILISTVVIGSVSANENPAEESKHERGDLGSGSFGEPISHGEWDDVWFDPTGDRLLARNDDAIYSISGDTPVKLRDLANTKDARAINTVKFGEVTSVLFEAATTVPFLVNLNTGDRIDFEIEGLDVPGERAPMVQGWVYHPTFHTGLVMVSGGDEKSWPLPGNGPIYYWVDFKTARSEMLPLGDRPEFFSDNMSVVVVYNYKSKERKVISMATGKQLDRYPIDAESADGKSYHVPYSWTNKDLAKPLFDEEQRFVGVNANGVAHPLGIVLEEPYIPSAKATQEAVAFFLRGYGSPRESSKYSLFIASLKGKAIPEKLSDQVKDYELLSNGLCVYSVKGSGVREDSHEAFYFDLGTSKKRNVLDGIERLEPLPEAIAKLDSVSDVMSVRFITNGGIEKNPDSVLCLFRHHRFDSRSIPFPRRAGTPSRIESQDWNKAIFISKDARRYEIEKYPDSIVAKPYVWVNESGTIFTAEIVWTGEKGKKRQLQVNRYPLKLVD